jgi:hypothetical protein
MPDHGKRRPLASALQKSPPRHRQRKEITLAERFRLAIRRKRTRQALRESASVRHPDLLERSASARQFPIAAVGKVFYCVQRPLDISKHGPAL